MPFSDPNHPLWKPENLRRAIFHELATNSLKYGALSVETGILDVSGSTDGDDVTLAWIERGGPGVENHSAPEGYGSKLLNRSVSGQLGGTISYDWSSRGLVVSIRVKAARLAR